MGKTRAFLLNDVQTWKAAYSQAELSQHPGKVLASTLKNKSIIFGSGNPEIKNFMTKVLNDDKSLHEFVEIIKNLTKNRSMLELVFCRR
ncbi:unnamed protein product [Allacma fusca]|uniref:Uncharacterized protein n=1 Tax=Allacma fusca TaxID=39272 RepID=A0A8J2KCB0_9HEXA|nr:unnamed protein product [Allacma fusca]